jgi:WD40 repeat protein
VWNAVSGEEELNLQHKHIVKSVNFSDDSVDLVTGSNDKVIRIFDLDKSNEGPKVRSGLHVHSRVYPLITSIFDSTKQPKFLFIVDPY